MLIKFVDIHSHIQLSQFDKDRTEVVARMRDRGVASIAVGIDAKTSEQAVNLAEKNTNIFASVGLHPNDVFTEKFSPEFYNKLLLRGKVVAVGECGLDYFRMDEIKPNFNYEQSDAGTFDLSEANIKQRQKEVFKRHIDLAVKFDKPMMIHCRPSLGSMDAYEDIIAILLEKRKKYKEKLRGNIHFFAGSTEIARKFLDLGFTLSFTGVVTFTNDYDKVIKNTPINMLMVETDAPFVAPVPYRGKRNEPVYVIEAIKRIAEIRGESEETIADAMLKNAYRSFDLRS